MSDVYLDTIRRMEPDIASVDAGAYYASAAISLKRIADALCGFNERLEPPNATSIVWTLSNDEELLIRQMRIGDFYHAFNTYTELKRRWIDKDKNNA